MPDKFGELQPHEFLQLWEGYRWRQEQEENRLAYFTAAAMSVHTTKAVQPKDLLQPLRQTEKQQNKKEDEEYLRKVFHIDGGEI